MKASALVLVLSYAIGAAGAARFDPSPSSAACSTRVGSTSRSCTKRPDQLVQHERQEEEGGPSFAKSWVTRARGGSSKVPAGGGGEKESGGKGKDRGGGGSKASEEVELALVGNFPNRCGCKQGATDDTAVALLL